MLEANYNEFLSYVKGTWGELMDNDWENEPEITKIFIDYSKTEFTVLVWFKPNKYYDYQNGEVVLVDYTGKAVKTNYHLNDNDVAYMLVKKDIIKDLGLNDVEIIMGDGFYFYEGFDIDDRLTRDLERIEMDTAEVLYCAKHDL